MKAKSAKTFLFWIVLFLLPTLFLELGLRAFFWVKSSYETSDRTLADKIGWRTEGFGKSTTYWPEYKELVKYSTTPNGFRIWGNRHTDRFRILVIGDSTTEALMISDGETYSDYLKKQHPEAEFFVYGCGGYGTLQEYMILEEFIGQIRPNLVIWQMDENDFFNNYRELEFRSFINNNHMKRPYLVQGEVVNSYPGLTQGRLYDAINSLVTVKVFKVNFDVLRSKNLKTVEDELHRNHPLFLESRKVTTELMQRVRQKASGIPIVAFSVLDQKRMWIGDVLQEMAREVGWYYVPDVSKKVFELRDSGIKVDGEPGDSHWNKVGHRVVGETVDQFLVGAGLVPSHSFPVAAGGDFAGKSPR